MRTSLVRMAGVIAALVCASNADAQRATYVPTTGSIVIDEVGPIGILQLISSENSGTDRLHGENANNLGGLVSTSSEQRIAWLFLQPISGGPFDLGPVAPRNATQTTLDNSYRLGVTIPGASCGGVCYYIPITGGFIPEPTALLLAGIGMIGLAVGGRLW